MLLVVGARWLIVCRDADLDRTARALVVAQLRPRGQRRGSVEASCTRVHDAPVARVAPRRRPCAWETPRGTASTWACSSTAASTYGDAGSARRYCTARAAGSAAARAPETTAVVRADGAGASAALGWFSWREKLRGPVPLVVKVADEAEAMAVCAEPAPGPVAYVFSDSEERASAVAEGLDAGTVLVNDADEPEQIIDAPMGSEGHSRRGGSWVEGLWR
ncbi:MAG: aldehyde dehydrogenase family protein [Polyangiales bacterium]